MLLNDFLTLLLLLFKIFSSKARFCPGQQCPMPYPVKVFIQGQRVIYCILLYDKEMTQDFPLLFSFSSQVPKSGKRVST